MRRAAACVRTCVRALPATARAPFATASPVSATVPVAPDVAPGVGVLTSIAKWRLSAAALEKTFEFRDATTTARFVDQANDLRARARRPFSVAAAPGGKAAEVAIPPEAPAAAAGAGALGEEQLALANAVDEIGATLQLQGRWG
jgi:hypothetical protein